jgi:hypothetical protein
LVGNSYRALEEHAPQRPERGDNHWLDCAVGAAVAASMEGVALPEVSAATPPKKKKVSYAEMYQAARRKFERDT